MTYTSDPAPRPRRRFGKVAAMAEKEAPHPQRAGRIRNARGRKATQVDPGALHLLRQHNVIQVDALQAVANERGVDYGRGACSAEAIVVRTTRYQVGEPAGAASTWPDVGARSPR